VDETPLNDPVKAQELRRDHSAICRGCGVGKDTGLQKVNRYANQIDEYQGAGQ
jgi:hypothetical protein